WPAPYNCGDTRPWSLRDTERGRIEALCPRRGDARPERGFPLRPPDLIGVDPQQSPRCPVDCLPEDKNTMVQVGGGIHDASRYEDTPNHLPVVEPQGETPGAGTNHVQRTRQPDPLRQGSRCLELLRRPNDPEIDDRYRRVRAGRVKADFVKRAVEDVLETNEIAEQAFIETVA